MKKQMNILLPLLIILGLVICILLFLTFRDYTTVTQLSKVEVYSTEAIELQISEESISEGAESDEEETTPVVLETKKADFKEISMVFSGDILLSDYVLNNYKNTGISGVISEDLLQVMTEADLTMVNQEFPFSTRGTKAEDKQFTFRLDPEYVSLFQEMGIDIVTLANNHVLDFGEEALLDTIDTLNEAEIQFAGAGENLDRAKQLQVIEVNERKIGFLAASRVIPVTSWNANSQKPGLLTTYDPTTLLEEITKAKESCDTVIVYVHWGIEKDSRPQNYQRTLGKQYIDAGADLVIGSHPHVLQGIEYYEGKPIIYSLGNFMFGSTISKTMLLDVKIQEDGTLKLMVIPAFAANARTSGMEEGQKKELYDYLESISFGITISEEGEIRKTE